jgi:hypothetical protein
MHRRWLTGSRPRAFDVVLVDYAGPAERYAGDGDLVLARAGTKLQNFAWACAEHLDGARPWRRVLLLDDDIETDADAIGRLFRTMRRYRLWIAGMAMLPGSHARWPIMLQEPGMELRFTNYVEVGLMALDTRVVPHVVPHVGLDGPGARTGWGLDMALPRMLGDPMDRVAVVDVAAGRHPHRGELELDRVVTRDQMREEGRPFVDRYLDGRMLVATTHRAVPLPGRDPVRWLAARARAWRLPDRVP